MKSLQRSIWSLLRILLFFCAMSPWSSPANAQSFSYWYMQKVPNLIPFNPSVSIIEHGGINNYHNAPPIPAFAIKPRWPVPGDVGENWRFAPSKPYIGYQENSRHCSQPNTCFSAADYAYFATVLWIPSQIETKYGGPDLTNFQFGLGHIDDGIRITIYNTKYPNGVTPPDGYVKIGDFNHTSPTPLTYVKSANLAPYLLKGEANAIIFTLIDDCCATMGVNAIDFWINNVQVTDRNNWPEITSTPVPYTWLGHTYKYKVVVNEPDNDPVTYTLLSGPTGATISSTGEILWDPKAGDETKKFTFRIRICDDKNVCQEEEWTIDVLKNSPNLPPVITSIPKSGAQINISYVYKIVATGPEGWDTVQYRLKKSPSGAILTNNTLTWTPQTADSGKNFDFEIEVCDSQNECVSQIWIVKVDTNLAPKIVSSPSLTLILGQDYQYLATAVDPNTGDVLRWKYMSGPDLYLSETGGFLEYIDAFQKDDKIKVGDKITLRIRVCDSGNLCDFQEWTVTVIAGNGKPFYMGVPSTTATVGVTYTYVILVVGGTGGYTYKIITGEPGATIDSSGKFTWKPGSGYTQGQNVPFVIEVCDSSNACERQTWNITVTIPNSPPTITSTPLLTSKVTKKYVYQMTATDPDAGDTLTYRLLLYPSGATISSNGLIEWQPNPSDEGKSFVFRAEVCDQRGNCSIQIWTVVLDTFQLPQFSSTPSTTAGVGLGYVYNPTIVYKEAYSTVEWKITEGSSYGFTIDKKTGAMTWTPSSSHTGSVVVEIEVCFDGVYCQKQKWTIVVSVIPYVEYTSSPLLTTTSGILYNYKPVAVLKNGSITQQTWKIIQGLDSSTGAAINPLTGEIKWIPSGTYANTTIEVILQVCYNNGAYCGNQKWFLKVLAAPVVTITSSPGSSAKVNESYTYEAKATFSSAYTKRSWKLVQGASEGASIDSSTGIFQWKPNSAHSGKVITFELQVCFDLICKNQSWTVNVVQVTLPVFTTTAKTTGEVLITYSYAPKVTFTTAYTTVSWKKKKGPAGATIHPLTGEISWGPSQNDGGLTHTFEIEVCFDGIYCQSQTWTVLVHSLVLPVFTSTPSSAGVSSKLYTYKPAVTYSGPFSPAKWALTKTHGNATIDPNTGEIAWTPVSSDIGKTVTFEIEVCYGGVACKSQTWTVVVSSPAVPSITSVPLFAGKAGTLYSYLPVVSYNATFTSKVWKLLQSPASATIDANTGKINWTPSNGDAGNTSVFEIEVCFETTICTTQKWAVVIENIGVAVFTSSPSTSGQVTVVYNYKPVVSYNLAFTKRLWKVLKKPSKGSMDANTGEISWTPESGDENKEHEWEIEVCHDVTGVGCAKQSWKVLVKEAPEVQITSIPLANAKVGVLYQYLPTATFSGSYTSVAWTFVKNTSKATVNPKTGEVQWSPETAEGGQSFAFEIQVCFESKYCKSQTWTVIVDVVGVAVITSTPSKEGRVGTLYRYPPTVSYNKKYTTRTWKALKKPLKAQINEPTGVIEWNPESGDENKEHDFEIEVCHDNGVDCAKQSWKVLVKPDFEAKITSVPLKKANVHVVYVYVPQVDFNGSFTKREWKFLKQHANAKLDPTSGEITWTPDRQDENKDHEFEIEVCHDGKYCAKQDWKVAVEKDDDPKIISSPSKGAKVGIAYSYPAKAEFKGKFKTEKWTLSKQPTQAKVDQNTGVVDWVPEQADYGKSIPFSIRVCYDQTKCAEQSWEVLVADLTPPKIVSTPIALAKVGTLYFYKPVVQYSEAYTQKEWKLKKKDNRPITIDAQTGECQWTPAQGTWGQSFTFQIEICFDGKYCDDQTWTVKVQDLPTPRFTTLALTSTRWNQPYVYLPLVEYKETFSKKEWKLRKAPSSVTMDPNSGQIDWQPVESDKNKSFSFTLEICFDRVACAEQTWEVLVIDGKVPPQIVTIPETQALVKKLYAYAPKAVYKETFTTQGWKLLQNPKSATMDSITGKIEWTPEEADKDKTFDFEIEVCFDSVHCAKQDWKVLVKGFNPPVIISTPKTRAFVLVNYTYFAEAEFKEAFIQRAWKLVKGPKNALIGQDTGLLEWTPQDTDKDQTFDFEIEVCYDNVHCANQKWQVVVSVQDVGGCSSDSDCAIGTCNQDGQCVLNKETGKIKENNLDELAPRAVGCICSASEKKAPDTVWFAILFWFLSLAYVQLKSRRK